MLQSWFRGPARRFVLAKGVGWEKARAWAFEVPRTGCIFSSPLLGGLEVVIKGWWFRGGVPCKNQEFNSPNHQHKPPSAWAPPVSNSQNLGRLQILSHTWPTLKTKTTKHNKVPVFRPVIFDQPQKTTERVELPDSVAKALEDPTSTHQATGPRRVRPTRAPGRCGTPRSAPKAWRWPETWMAFGKIDCL